MGYKRKATKKNKAKKENREVIQRDYHGYHIKDFKCQYRYLGAGADTGGKRLRNGDKKEIFCPSILEEDNVIEQYMFQ